MNSCMLHNHQEMLVHLVGISEKWRIDEVTVTEVFDIWKQGVSVWNCLYGDKILFYCCGYKRPPVSCFLGVISMWLNELPDRLVWSQQP